jgi:hypothetical protein
VVDQTDPWAAFSPQAAPADAPAFGGRPVIHEAPPPAKTTYRSLTPDEIKSRGLNPSHAYQLSSEGSVSDLGATSPKPPEDPLSKANQANAAGFYSRALNANNGYGEGVSPRDAGTQMFVNLFPNGVVRSFESDARKNAETYAAEFVASTLRKESGAAISPQEYESQFSRYFPQPGDGPEQIATKKQLRAQALEAMRLQAGPAADSISAARRAFPR